MSADLIKALNVRAPNDFKRTLNDFGWQKLPATAASQNIALPREWAGRWVMVYIPVGGTDVTLAFSIDPTAQIDVTVAATTVFPTLKVGIPLPAGFIHQIRAPYIDVPDVMRLVFQSTGNQTFLIGLGDQI